MQSLVGVPVPAASTRAEVTRPRPRSPPPRTWPAPAAASRRCRRRAAAEVRRPRARSMVGKVAQWASWACDAAFGRDGRVGCATGGVGVVAPASLPVSHRSRRTDTRAVSPAVTRNWSGKVADRHYVATTVSSSRYDANGRCTSGRRRPLRNLQRRRGPRVALGDRNDPPMFTVVVSTIGRDHTVSRAAADEAAVRSIATKATTGRRLCELSGGDSATTATSGDQATGPPMAVLYRGSACRWSRNWSPARRA